MKTLLKYCLIVATQLCSIICLTAQQKAIGYIIPNDSLSHLYPQENILYLPLSGLNIYEKPNGKNIGFIVYGTPTNSFNNQVISNKNPMFQHAVVQFYNSAAIAIEYNLFFEEFNDCLYLTYFEEKNNFIKVYFNNSNYGWLSIKEITKANFKLKNWIDFYGKAHMNLTTPPPPTLLPLKISPHEKANTIIMLNDDDFDIKVIGKQCENNFCYVEVIQYKKHPIYNGDYSEKNIIQKYKGWLQIVNQKNEALVRHTPNGC